MCPHVLWDEQAKLYRMWYSGGEQEEPNAIGYATSLDGLAWTKHEQNPVFSGDHSIAWEQERVTGCQVEKRGDWYLMFYIGFRDIHHAQIGIARSRDGITGWQRHPANPIVRSGTGKWDDDACYKPFAIFDGQKVAALVQRSARRAWNRSAWSSTRGRTWAFPLDPGNLVSRSWPGAISGGRIAAPGAGEGLPIPERLPVGILTEEEAMTAAWVTGAACARRVHVPGVGDDDDRGSRSGKPARRPETGTGGSGQAREGC